MFHFPSSIEVFIYADTCKQIAHLESFLISQILVMKNSFTSLVHDMCSETWKS